MLTLILVLTQTLTLAVPPTQTPTENIAAMQNFCLSIFLQGLPYLFEYNAQNFVLIFNQKLRVRVIHE